MTSNVRFRVGPIILTGLTLAFAVALQFRGRFGDLENSRPVDLRQYLASEPTGWTFQDLPNGETEFRQVIASSTLRYDSYFFRAYRRGTTEFTVYVAYWGPGKHPPQMIAQHVPDRCWTMNGMVCEEARFDQPAKIDGIALWPSQWRKFRAVDGGIQYTMFWHMVGDRPYDFGTRFYDMPSPSTYWSEALRFAVGSKPVQFFFRITSNLPPEQIWNEPGFQQAIHGFLTLGLGKRGK